MTTNAMPHQMKGKDWKQYEIVEEAFHDLWSLCYPRRYEETGKGQYDTPKCVARSLMDALLGYHGAYMDGGKPGETEQNEAVFASLMVKYNVPTYYLSHDVAVALTQTTPAAVLDCAAIKLPFPAASFMLPKGILTHPEYGDVSFVSYARMHGGSEVRCPSPNGQMGHNLFAPEGKFIFSVFLRTVQGNTLHWSFDSELRLVDLKNEEELEQLQKLYSHSSTSFPGEYQNFTPNDIAAMTRTIRLVFNILLLMTHKSELVDPARLLKRVNKNGRSIEYWKPHIIGSNYKLRREGHGEGTGTHASPRGHWVSGFWREQVHGPERSLRKTLWIDPFWRGGDI